MQEWLFEQTNNLKNEHAEDLKHRLEILIHNEVCVELNDLFYEIIENFTEEKLLVACSKLNMILKILITKQGKLLNINHEIESEELDIILDLCFGLQNAISIIESKALQHLFTKDMNDE